MTAERKEQIVITIRDGKVEKVFCDFPTAVVVIDFDLPEELTRAVVEKLGRDASVAQFNSGAMLYLPQTVHPIPDALRCCYGEVSKIRAEAFSQVDHE
jgi:hypothetical protein